MPDSPPTAASIGDMFILLVPDDSELDHIRRWQRNLQAYFGGQCMTPVHITCQRFASPSQAVVETLLQTLNTQFAAYKAIPVIGCRLTVIHSPFHQSYLLKCQVEMTEPLASFGWLMQDILTAYGIVGHHPAPLSDQVTTLTQIQAEATVAGLPAKDRPSYLFTGAKLIVSVAIGYDQFDHVGIINFT